MEKYEEFLLKDYHVLRNFCKVFSRIYVYGAGDVSERILEYLETIKIKVEAILVSDGHRSKSMFHGHKVYEISEICIGEEDAIILAVSKETQKPIEKVLKLAGVPKTHIYRQNIYGPYGDTSYTMMECNAALREPLRQNEYFFASFTDLDSIGKKQGTDKSSELHNYLNKYEFFLRPWKNKAFNLLELGILHGKSLQMWEKYFPKACIWGVDIDPTCKQYEENNIHVVISDLSRTENILSFQKVMKGQPDIIIDDASHLWSHQIKALFSLFPYLTHGGIYILEDLETSFLFYQTMGYDDASVSAYEICSAIAEVVTGHEHLQVGRKAPAFLGLSEYIEAIAMEIDMISFIHGSCIIIKK